MRFIILKLNDSLAIWPQELLQTKLKRHFWRDLLRRTNTRGKITCQLRIFAIWRLKWTLFQYYSIRFLLVWKEPRLIFKTFFLSIVLFDLHTALQIKIKTVNPSKEGWIRPAYKILGIEGRNLSYIRKLNQLPNDNGRVHFEFLYQTYKTIGLNVYRVKLEYVNLSFLQNE